MNNRDILKLSMHVQWWAAILFATIPLAAQAPAPIGLVQGALLHVERARSPGEISIRTQDNHVYAFLFDNKTYFEREGERTTAAGLQKGDWLEIVSDQWPGTTERYARTVHVIDRQPPAQGPPAVARSRAYRSVLNARPRGDLTFSGVVTRLNGERLVLHMHDGEKTIALRPDTRYLFDGNLVEAGELSANTRVFVRAGRNAEGRIEAYQVVWGEILEPR